MCENYTIKRSTKGHCFATAVPLTIWKVEDYQLFHSLNFQTFWIKFKYFSKDKCFLSDHQSLKLTQVLGEKFSV